jgi:hypothetical protein
MKASVRLEHQLLAVESEHTVHAMLELTTPVDIARPPLRAQVRKGPLRNPRHRPSTTPGEEQPHGTAARALGGATR